MASRRKAFVHVGLDDGHGAVLERALAAHAHPLLELRVRHPAKHREELLRGVLDLLGTHADYGYARPDVAGAWDELARRSAKGKDTVVLSQPLLAAARGSDAGRLAASLAPRELHPVITVAAPDARTLPADPAHDLAAVLDRWQRVAEHPGHVHVLVLPDPADAAATWRGLGRVAGFGTTSLKVDHLALPPRRSVPASTLAADVVRKLGEEWAELLTRCPFDVVGDPEHLVPDDEGYADVAPAATCEQALAQAHRDLDRLTRHTEALEHRLAVADRKRAKLKRRLVASG